MFLPGLSEFDGIDSELCHVHMYPELLKNLSIRHRSLTGYGHSTAKTNALLWLGSFLSLTPDCGEQRLLPRSQMEKLLHGQTQQHSGSGKNKDLSAASILREPSPIQNLPRVSSEHYRFFYVTNVKLCRKLQHKDSDRATKQWRNHP